MGFFVVSLLLRRGLTETFTSVLGWSLFLSSVIFFAFTKTTSIWRSVALKSWQRVVIQCEILASLFILVFGFIAVLAGEIMPGLTIIGILVALLVLALGGGLVGAVMSAIAAALSDHSDLEEVSKHPLD